MTMAYSGGNVLPIMSTNAAVVAFDLLLALIIAVLPPAIEAANTPIDNKTGKLNGEMINETP